MASNDDSNRNQQSTDENSFAATRKSFLEKESKGPQIKQKLPEVFKYENKISFILICTSIIAIILVVIVN